MNDLFDKRLFVIFHCFELQLDSRGFLSSDNVQTLKVIIHLSSSKVPFKQIHSKLFCVLLSAFIVLGPSHLVWNHFCFKFRLLLISSLALRTIFVFFIFVDLFRVLGICLARVQLICWYLWHSLLFLPGFNVIGLYVFF